MLPTEMGMTLRLISIFVKNNFLIICLLFTLKTWFNTHSDVKYSLAYLLSGIKKEISKLEISHFYNIHL